MHLHVDAKGVAEARGEDVHLLAFGDVVAAGEELEEGVLIGGDLARAAQMAGCCARVARSGD